MDIKQIKTWDEANISETVMLDVAKRSAVYFAQLPSRLFSETLLIKALEVNPRIANVIPSSLITKKMIERFGSQNIELLNKADDALFDEPLSTALVKENPECYPFVSSSCLPTDIIIKAIDANPVNITYTAPDKVTKEVIEKTGGVERYRAYLSLLEGKVQRVFCELSPSLIKSCQKLESEDLFVLLPTVTCEDTKSFIMKKLGK